MATVTQAAASNQLVCVAGIVFVLAVPHAQPGHHARMVVHSARLARLAECFPVGDSYDGRVRMDLLPTLRAAIHEQFCVSSRCYRAFTTADLHDESGYSN